MDDADEPDSPPPAKLSKTPSWVMLGFVMGVLAAFSLPRSREKAESPPPMVVRAEPKPPEPVTPPTIDRAQFFEAVFAENSQKKIWQSDPEIPGILRTEVAFWDTSRKAFSDCFEVLQVGDKYYFRSIPRLTQPVLEEGVSSDSLLRFTVPAEVARMQAGPTFDEINRGIFSRQTRPTFPPPATKPLSPPIIEAPKVELPRVDNK